MYPSKDSRGQCRLTARSAPSSLGKVTARISEAKSFNYHSRGWRRRKTNEGNTHARVDIL